ncbi:MAG TPA: AglZ/HisF2 family acetamidino modification protein [Gemmatimonadaceae bacterium]|nr:AglZ/HisF2 family acetamidino modification protein [Gemmatimonadaceae bacterium]
MWRTRVIPTLLLHRGGLVKTERFRKPKYVGDPINAARIFNEKEVDELVVLDIGATVEGREPDMRRIEELAGECFMPLAYGGGIRTLEQVGRILTVGIEKVVLNSVLASNPAVVSEASRMAGSQSVVVSIDARRRWWGAYRTYTRGGRTSTGLHPVEAAKRAEDLGAGEILLTSIDREGTYRGYDLELIAAVSSAVTIPVVACGGARQIDDLAAAIGAGASASAAGSLFVFNGPHRAVLISFPDPAVLKEKLAS